MKTCTKCNVTKPLCEFYPKGRSFVSRCKECEKEVCRQKMKRMYHQDIEIAREKTRNKKRVRYWSSKENRTRQIDLAKKWRHDNPEKLRQVLKKYYEANKDMFVAARHRRRSRIAGNGGKFTAKEWQDILKHCRNTCLCCGKKEPDIKLSLDHVIPVSRGGTNNIGNIQPLCIGCNKKKFTKSVDYRKGAI